MISSERLTKALEFIATTDEDAAELKTNVERQAYIVKKVKSAIIEHEDGAMELRKAKAETSPETESAMDIYLEAYRNYAAMDNKRKTEYLVVEVWRSLNANRRQGNI